MTASYWVRLNKEYHVFSVAHFITFNGDICERIHGHNYKVFAEVFGPLDENEYVIDFIALRDSLKKITDELDHHVILPDSHPKIKVSVDEKEVLATFEDRRWIFPKEDCIILPVANTTAELLAHYIGKHLLDDVEKLTGVRVPKLRIGVDENEGQWGICELDGE